MQENLSRAELVDLVAAHVDCAVVVVSEDNVIRHANPGAERLFGVSATELVGRPFPFTLHPDESQEVQAVQAPDQSWTAEMCVVQVEQKGARYFVASLRDLADRDQLHEVLRSTVLYDELTGLLNRNGYFTLTRQQVKVAERSQRGMVILLVDIDGMSDINQEHGRDTGDEALREAAGVLRRTFRDSDILGRIGGDVFAVTCIEAHRDSAGILLARLREGFWQWNARSSNGYQLSVSIGYARYNPMRPESIENLLSAAEAELVLYRKGRGRLAARATSRAR